MSFIPRPALQRGFTLIGLVITMVIISVASLALINQFSAAGKSYLSNEHLQTSTQLAQACAEHILATRRLQTYAIATASSCPALPASYTTAGYAHTLSVDAAPAACVTLPCAQVSVIVTRSGTEQARIVFMLGNY